jgi:hypothetical protein
MTYVLHALSSKASVLSSRWPLSRVVVLVLAGTFAALAADLRLEHVEAVREHQIAWTPIVYSCATALVAGVAAWRWSDLTRRVALACFLLGVAVGMAGFYFHNRGNLFSAPVTLLHAWTDSTMEHSAAPPQNAPMNFATLGLLGTFACLKRFSTTAHPAVALQGAAACRARSKWTVGQHATPGGSTS